MDDRLAFASGNKLYAAQKSSGDSWWLPLVEKAMAKLNGNYIQLEKGSIDLGFRELTGMPTYKLSTKGMKNRRQFK